MPALIPPDELAKQIEVPVSTLITRTSEQEWVRRKFPVSQWAVWDEDGELIGYEVPAVVRDKLGLSDEPVQQEGSWWSSLVP